MVNFAVVSHNSVNELYYLEEVDSTNTWAKANLDKFGPVGAVYTTSQTAGRGRRGHTWINASGQALYYTVVLKTELAQPESLPLFASMAVADALEQRYGIQCQIKWPNDLVLEGRKLAGILTEASLSARGVDHVVIGIGVNLRQRPDDFSPEVARIATSLEAQGYPADRAALETALAEALCQAFGHLHTPEVYAADYRRLCLNLGQTLRIPDTGETVTALDIDRQYGLVVRRRDGTVDTLRCGEVSVRGLYGYI